MILKVGQTVYILTSSLAISVGSGGVSMHYYVEAHRVLLMTSNGEEVATVNVATGKVGFVPVKDIFQSQKVAEKKRDEMEGRVNA